LSFIKDFARSCRAGTRMRHWCEIEGIDNNRYVLERGAGVVARAMAEHMQCSRSLASLASALDTAVKADLADPEIRAKYSKATGTR